MPPTMSLVAFKDAMSLALLLDHSVWSSFGYPWLQESATGHLGSLAKDACAALSRCAFGRRHGQRHIELEGAVSYGQVLREVRSQLATSKSVDGLLVLMLLMSYTANSQQSQQEFDIHLEGMIALLQTTGPEPYQDPRLAKAFSSCRCMLILTGVISRKHSFLEEDVWLHKTWTSDEISNGQDRLVDILAAIPGILEDMTPLEVQLSKRAGLRQSLQRRIQRSLEELQAWRRRWDAAFPKPTRDVPRTKPPAFTRRELPPEAESLLVYESFERSAEFSLHSAILICLLSLSKSIVVPDLASWEVREARWHEMLISDNWNPLPDVPTIGRGLGLRAVAIQIVRTFEYQLQHIQHHQERALFWLFPWGLAGLILIEEPLWMSTIEDLRRASQGDRGYGQGPDTVVPEAAVSAVCWSRNPDLTSNEAVGSAHCFWYAAQGGWKKAERIWSIHP
nr:hypothetical protein B0A51_16293 [Rachicladosporium sp. CCFEE 5018]